MVFSLSPKKKKSLSGGGIQKPSSNGQGSGGSDLINGGARKLSLNDVGSQRLSRNLNCLMVTIRGFHGCKTRKPQREILKDSIEIKSKENQKILRLKKCEWRLDLTDKWHKTITLVNISSSGNRLFPCFNFPHNFHLLKFAIGNTLKVINLSCLSNNPVSCTKSMQAWRISIQILLNIIL